MLKKIAALVQGQGEHRPVGQAIGDVEALPDALLVQRQAVVGAGPDTVAIHGDAVDAVIGQAIGYGEVLPAEAR